MIINSTGNLSLKGAEHSAQKQIDLLQYSDTWRTLVDVHPETWTDSGIVWTSSFGGQSAYNLDPKGWIRPLAFDVWGDPGTLQPHAPIPFEGCVNLSTIQACGHIGSRIRISLRDLRDASHPIQRTLAVPVGFRIPYRKGTRAYGIKEMYLEPEILDSRVDAADFPRDWHYLEAALFGGKRSTPLDPPSEPYAVQRREIHCGAPMALFREPESDHWFALTGEADYGASLLWRDDYVLLYTTLYLRPGDAAEWSCCQWIQPEAEPANVYLSATRPDGFFDCLNPPGLTRRGAPEGPIAFININRPEAHFEQLRKVKPKLVILNYFYDHVSSVAGLYGEWKTYEGFHMSETKLKALIKKIKAMGAKVGYYGTQVEQPESHPPLKESDIVLDAWGRRFHAWEPGNWVVDCGNTDCADRLARAEAEFARHYGLDCVFIDRQDHMSVNANPERVGQSGNQRLECIPSVRLGLLELNKRRVFWQRKLNPELLIGINNTTQWVGGVRYADFNLLEGGMDLQPPIFLLNAPFGVVHKQHYNLFFADYDRDIVDHGIVQGQNMDKTFDAKRRRFFRIALADGVAPQPYEDEIFVAPDSQFAKGWNDRNLPDAEKTDFYAGITFYGGDQWREDCATLAPALRAANLHCFPIARIWPRPDMGDIPENCRFSAREGVSGGVYIGIYNQGDTPRDLDIRVGDIAIQARLEAWQSHAWFRSGSNEPLEHAVFR